MPATSEEVFCSDWFNQGILLSTAAYLIGIVFRRGSFEAVGGPICSYSINLISYGGGAIVNISSILGHVTFANSAAYTAAKHGVVGLSKAAAIDYATEGIRVNSVCPAFIYTPMLERAGFVEGSEMYTTVANMHPVKRMGTPEEVAEAVVWLCSDASSFVTGHSMLVDGGYVAR